VSTFTGVYPATLPEAHDEIRALRAELLHLRGRIQTVESWAEQSEDDAREINRAGMERRRRVARMARIEEGLRP
jgi:two-component sensor histidine kinase